MTTPDPGNGTLEQGPPKQAWRVGGLNKEIGGLCTISKYPACFLSRVINTVSLEFGMAHSEDIEGRIDRL